MRPFEEIFRADQSGESASQRQRNQQQHNQGGQQGGNQHTRLAELQKQIVIATWKLQQDKTVATEREQTMKMKLLRYLFSRAVICHRAADGAADACRRADPPPIPPAIMRPTSSW